tara:strand:- start:328 stop:540 length:213 start_codon:yes stop_codon:yes gene_type:complete
MKSDIKGRYKKMQELRQKVLEQPTEFVDKSSYIQAIDFNLSVLKDLIFLIDSVNEERQDLVSDWFKRFRK